MRTSFLMTHLAALAVLIMTGHHSPSYAANCEADLKPFYTCTATFDTGGSVNYCVAVDYAPRTDGEFLMTADNTYYAFCTCKAQGTLPNVKFGVAKNFFCTEADTNTVSIGTASKSVIKGQGFNTSVGVRSVFTCQAAAACP
jgi:hypothetical protein